MSSRPPLAPLLRVRGLALSFGGVEVLRDLDFVLGAGSLTGLIGPNGAGKTALFDVLSGLVRPRSGSVRLGNEELVGLAPHRITELGLARTFQKLRVFPELSLLDNVLAGMQARFRCSLSDALLRRRGLRDRDAAAQAEAWRLLDLLGLRALAAVAAGELSFGAQRRLEIARALASDPALLLLDEPVAGMDPREAGDLLACIRSLRSAGHAVLLIEHDMGFVMELCEQVLVLNGGSLIAQGDPEEVRASSLVMEAYRGYGAPAP